MSHDTSKAIGRGYRVARAAFALCGLLFASFCFAKSVPGASLWGSVLHHASAQRDDGASADRPGYHFRNIEDIRVGDRVLAGNPDVNLPEGTSVDPATWRKLVLRAEDRWDDGTLDDINVQTLQPPEWIEEHGAHVGASVPIPLDLVDMGMPEELRATVVANEQCPPIRSGPGRVVLTTVNHLNCYVLELVVRDKCGNETAIRPTGYHKFNRANDGAWVSAETLQPDDLLRGLHDSLTVCSIQRLIGTHRVFNMTVEGEHVYNVSAFGVLVHNQGCRPVVMPGGEPIGRPGSRPGIQEVPGGLPAAEDLFDRLTEASGGTPTNQAGYPGTVVKPPGGGFIGIRPMSGSGDPAIDIKLPDVPEIDKIHFPEK